MSETIDSLAPAGLTVEECAAALKTRDRAYDGRFVYGVITTGVFCRPSCPARPARPENIRFFATPADAAKAGLRPCKRCKPLSVGGADPDSTAMAALAAFIEAHAEETLTLERLGTEAGISASHVQKRFKAAFGISPKAFQDAVRMRRLRAGLKGGDSVTGALYDAGYGSTSRLYGPALRSLGMTPSAYRSGGAGEIISHACRETALGPLLMAATDRGVCFAQFGDSEADLRDRLQAEFPNATLSPAPAESAPALDQWMEALDAHLSHGAPRPDMPLDLRGTAFQIRVWRFLLSIKEGDVVSYADVAEGIGSPGAARATGTACGANRVAVLVPCHRVLRGDGALGGYRWGLERKRALLDQERAKRRGGRP